MDADLSRLPVGTSGWLTLVNYALELGDLSEVDYLELKGALSFTDRQSRKRSAVVVSRAILAMANRMPDLAEKHFSGSGVVFVGIDQSQKLVGVDAVDAAVLRDLIEPYVGEDGPTWDHQFIDHPDGLVLAVIVDPPQWGDRIHPCRKDYSDDASKLAIRDGEVLVRVPGKSRPATSYDLMNLERRRVKAPHTGAQVQITYSGAFDRTSRANVRDLIENMVGTEANALIEGIPNSVTRSSYVPGIQSILDQTSVRADRRSTEQFRADVEQWQKECRDATERVVTEFLLHTLDHGTFVIRNESDRYLENVRVEVSFRSDVTLLMASDSDYCDHGGQFKPFQILPERPPKYGDLKPYGFDHSGLYSGIKPATLSHPAPNMDLKATPNGYVVFWYAGDLPPRATISADEEFAMFTDENLRVHNHGPTKDHHAAMPTEIGGTWEVTARAVDYVFQGEVTVNCRQELGTLLLWQRGTSN